MTVAPGRDDAVAHLREKGFDVVVADEDHGRRVDVDVLAAKVKRGAELLRICRGRISAARVEVTQIVAELEPDANADASS